MASTTSKGYPYPDPTDPDKPREDIGELAKSVDSAPGIAAMTQAERDVLTAIWPGRMIANLTSGRIEVNLSGTAGDWQWVLDATRPVPIANGGTGLNVAPSIAINLASTSPASPFTPEPRPGVTGVLPMANGGHGASTPADARTNLAVYSKAEIGNPETDFVAVLNAALTA